MKIRETDIKDIVPYENNPRFNESAVDAVANSIRDFGFKVPIIVDKNNIIIAGHTRLLAAKKLGLERVPVLMADDLTDEQVKAFRLADNKVGEIATWDDIKLSAELEALSELGWDMTQFGFNPEDIEIPDPTDDDFDGEMEYQKITIPNAHLGDIYQLGDHRLMCGDSTKPEDVAKLMDGCEADLVITDPPYNVDIGQGGSITRMRAQNHRQDGATIMNDNMNEGDFYDFLRNAFENIRDILKLGGGLLYLVCASK